MYFRPPWCPAFSLQAARRATLFALTWISGQVAAADIPITDFSLRLPAALAEFSPYPDVAAVGGASAGSRYSTSVNPAATDWEASLAHPYSVSAQQSTIRFNTAPTLRVTTATAAIKTELIGSFLFAASRIDNNGSESGDFLLLSGHSAQIQWGYKLSDSLAIGVNFGYTPFDTKGGAGGMLLASGKSDTYGGRIGVLWAPTAQFITGLVADYARAPATTDFFVPDCSCFIPNKDTTKQVLIRPGISYEYAAKSSIYVDYQHGRFQNFTGSLSTNWLFSGLEQRVVPWLYARVGLAYDFHGKFNPTAGIGLSPSEAVSIDIAYQDDMFPDLRSEFGRSKLFAISLSLAF